MYTGESLKAYKILDAYNYYMNGWVSSIAVLEVPCLTDTCIVVLGQVRHSQGVSASYERFQQLPFVCCSLLSFA